MGSISVIGGTVVVANSSPTPATNGTGGGSGGGKGNGGEGTYQAACTTSHAAGRSKSEAPEAGKTTQEPAPSTTDTTRASRTHGAEEEWWITKPTECAFSTVALAAAGATTSAVGGWGWGGVGNNNSTANHRNWAHFFDTVSGCADTAAPSGDWSVGPETTEVDRQLFNRNIC